MSLALALSLTHKSLKVRSLRQLQLHVRMALQQEEGGERERARVRDRRSAPLLKRSGTRCRRRWEVRRQLLYLSFMEFDKLHYDSDELCVFQQIGWLDESYEFDNATAVADIATLPQEVNASFLNS